MKKLFFISLFSCLIIVSGFTQEKQKRVQIALGLPYDYTSSRIQIDFSRSDYAIFRSIDHGDVFTGSVMLLGDLSPKVSLRYGLELRGLPLSSELRFEHNVHGPQALPYDYTIMDINVPLDVVYEPLDWIYLLGGIYPTLRVDFTGGKDFGRNGFLSAEETKKYFDKLKSHLSHLGFNYRLGIGYRYKKTIGLELTYEELLTNVLRDEFTFGQVSRPTTIKHSAIFLKLVFHLVHSRQTFLDWEGKAK